VLSMGISACATRGTCATIRSAGCGRASGSAPPRRGGLGHFAGFSGPSSRGRSGGPTGAPRYRSARRRHQPAGRAAAVPAPHDGRTARIWSRLDDVHQQDGAAVLRRTERAISRRRRS
jgi:hypothetical protein